MIQIKEIEIEGFCSIVEPFSYNFDIPSINLIWGNNGAGKSTIFNALAWVLYGKLIKPKRSITPWKNIQLKGFNGTKVKVKIYIENDGYYTIVRCKDFKGRNDLEFWKGSTNFPGRRKAEIEKEIEKVLGISFELFKASVTFGQNLSRFLKLPSGEQKEILDEAFAINYINEARDKAKKERELLVTESNNLKINMEKVDSEHTIVKNNLKEIETLKNNFDTDKKNKLFEIRKELGLIRTKIKGYHSDKDKRKQFLEAIKKQKTLVDSMQSEIASFKLTGDTIFKMDFEASNDAASLLDLKNKRKELMMVISKPSLTCFTCGQVINKIQKDKQKRELKNKLSKLNLEISELNESLTIKRYNLAATRARLQLLSGVEERFNNTQKIIADTNDVNLRLGNISENLRLAIKNKNQLINKLRETRKSEFGYKIEKQRRALINLEAKLVMLNFKNQKLRKEIKLHDWVINDPLSNKGIKAYIFNLMIQKINHKLYEYSKKVGFAIKLSIDLESANKTFNAEISKMNQLISYDDLSGGEEQLVDACLAFSMHDVISNNRFNILLLDEVFESLDKDNIDLIYEIIDYKSKSTNIHLISHRKSFISRANAVTEL